MFAYKMRSFTHIALSSDDSNLMTLTAHAHKLVFCPCDSPNSKIRCAVTTAAVAAHQPRAGSLSKVRQIPLRRGNLGMDARCAGAAAAIAILLLLP